jgi:hypothetical protein
MNDEFINTIIECLIVGIISVIFCILSYKIIYAKDCKTLSKSLFNINEKKYPNLKKNMVICFFLGATTHFIIKQSNLTKTYCKKVCYDDKCWLVCDI